MSKEVQLEIVNYRTDHIAQVSVALIRDFAEYSGIYGTQQWVGGLVHLLRIIENQQPLGFKLTAEGVELFFSGFHNPIPVIKNENIVFQSREPRFTIRDKAAEVLPRQRTRIGRAISDITEEMRSVYHLRTEPFPCVLIFPKQQFAKEQTIFAATLIGHP